MGRSAPEETGVARFADGVLEAGWLLALALVPAFFDIYSSQPFELSKAMVVRLLAVLMAAAGLVRALEARGRWRWPREAPLLVPVLVYLGAAALSTALSVAPRLSLWGSHARGEGLVTLLAYVVVCAGLASRLRRREQLDRVIDAIVAGSIPVGLYGLMQAAGLELLDWRLTYQEWRVSTTLGNPIFAGSYLILTLPLTLAALVEWRGRPVSGPGARWWRRARLALYASAAVLQLTVLGLTGSRGPWLGGAAALVAFALLGAALGRRRKLAMVALALGVAGAVFVAVLNVPRGPLEAARQTRLLGRLGHIFDKQGDRNRGDRARVLVWEGALALARPRPPLAFAVGEDRRSALRPIIGYGPETLQFAFGAVYDAEFARLERRNPDLSDEGISTFHTRVPDRSHNELLDSLVTGGLLGALAHLLLSGAIQVFGLGALGLLATPGDRRRLATLALVGGAVGALAGGLALSWGFVGVGLPLGLVAGWMAHVLACAFRAHEPDPRPATPVQVALLAALLGHFVDVHFGPVVVTGRLYFWALTGLLVAASAPRYREDPTAAEAAVLPREAPARRWTALAAGAPAGLLAAALAVTLAYDFVGTSAKRANPVAAAWRIVTAGDSTHRAILAASVASVLIVLLLEAGRRSDSRAGTLLGAMIVATTLGLAFAAVHTAALRRTAEARNVDDLAASLLGLFARYIVGLLGLALLLGAALARVLPVRPVGAALRAAAVLAAALALVVPRAVASVGADVMSRFASALQVQGHTPETLALFDRAAALAPWEATHFRSQGEAYLTGSRRTGSPVRRAEYLRRAEGALGRARALDPLAPDLYANLARLAKWRAELSRVASAAQRELEEADRHYAAAARLVPANTLLLNDWAELDYGRRQEFAAAEEKLQRSLRLDPTFDYTYAALGDMYMARARAGGNPAEDYRRAAASYEQAFARRPSVKAITSVGLAYQQLGENERAIGAYERALALRPPLSTSWAVQEQLSGLYLALGNRAEAERHAQEALWQVPEKERAALTGRLRGARLVPGT